MSVYDLDHIIKMWATEKLTPEQAIGQVLLHIQNLVERVDFLERAQPRKRYSDRNTISQEQREEGG